MKTLFSPSGIDGKLWFALDICVSGRLTDVARFIPRLTHFSDKGNEKENDENAIGEGLKI